MAYWPAGKPIVHRLTKDSFYVGVENSSSQTVRGVRLRLTEMTKPPTAIDITLRADSTNSTSVDIRPGDTELFFLGWGYSDDHTPPNIEHLTDEALKAMARDKQKNDWIGMRLVNAAASQQREIFLLKNDDQQLQLSANGDDVPPARASITVNAKVRLEVLVAAQ